MPQTSLMGKEQGVPATTPIKSYGPDYAVPPGETIEEMIDELGMDQQELSIRLGLSAKHVNQMIRGHASITHETAIALERVLGVPAGFWLSREAIYRERLAKIKEKKRLEADLGWLKQIPVKALVRRGVIKPTNDRAELLGRVLAFFGVSSTASWAEYWDSFKVAARRSRCFQTHRVDLAVWLRLGELQAQQIECEPFNRSRFRRAASGIRELTTADPEQFVPKTRELCAKAGVAFVLIPGMKGVPWHGASWWHTPSEAIIELNLRGRGEDQFWFSFFHEVGHILKGHSKKEVFVNDDSEDDPREQEANEFASRFLIPPEFMAQIPRCNREELLSLAREAGISPGIVAGQYQRLTGKYNYPWVHRLIRKLAWTNE